MSAIIYIDTTDKSCYNVEPDLSNKNVIGIDIPSGIPVSLLINQISAFIAGINQTPLPLVIKVTFQDPVTSNIDPYAP